MSDSFTSNKGFVVVSDTYLTIKRVILNRCSTIQIEAGHNFEDIILPDDLSKFLNFFNTLKQESTFDWEISIQGESNIEVLTFSGLKDGENYVILAFPASQYTELLDELMGINNEQVSILRKHLQEKRQLSEKADSYFNDITKINNELINVRRELTRTNLELKRTNKEKNKLLGMISHDLKNSIGGINSLAGYYLHKESYSTEEIKEVLHVFETSSEQMLELIKDLFDYSRIEEGTIELSKKQHDIISVIQESIRINRLMAKEKSIEICFNNDIRTQHLSFDQNRLLQVLNNILQNSVKYSFPNSSITVSAFHEGNYICIKITDEGMGIPQKDIPHIFTPYYKTANKPTGKEHSTGLGLSIVKNIIEQHGGSISVESKTEIEFQSEKNNNQTANNSAPTGTIITIYLPL